MSAQKSSTNLKNRVQKLHLPKTKPLLPLFEVISNAIHSIDEERKINKNGFSGKIVVNPIRNGDPVTLLDLDVIEHYPIHSFKITDNGTGLNSTNYKSFQEFDSDYKSKIGGKGIGRLVCLKAFNKLDVYSTFLEKDKYYYRSFEYKKTKDGFDDYKTGLSAHENIGTQIILSKFEDEYQKQCSYEILDIARQIISHFQLYFIQGKEPSIIIRDQNNVEKNLTKLYSEEFDKQVLKEKFKIDNTEFRIFISKSFKAKSHKIHYCAHSRTVKEEGLSKYNSDLKHIATNEGSEGFYFQVYVVSDYLDNNVNEERTGFNFSTDDDENEITDLQLIEGVETEITLAKIRNKTLGCIEVLLKDFLVASRQKKLDGYFPVIKNDFPNYIAVVNHNREEVERLPVGLNKNELDIALYQIESKWRQRVKEHGVEILTQKKDITNLDDYKRLYEKFLSEFNEIGQSDLARYVIHRRSVIDLLDKLWAANENNKFTEEEIIHSLFFPIRETADTVPYDKQNLWLLDERLTFNTLLASDKTFNQIKEIDSNSPNRMDLIIHQSDIYSKATLFAERKHPFECFTIVEFKKPNRDDYVYGDEKLDPIAQVRKYIREIMAGKVKSEGRVIDVKAHTPFYCYIVADITKSLKMILDEERFFDTPDGAGAFQFYETKGDRGYFAYIEIIPFQKVIKDAKQRNRVLFEKLNLSS